MKLIEEDSTWGRTPLGEYIINGLFYCGVICSFPHFRPLSSAICKQKLLFDRDKRSGAVIEVWKLLLCSRSCDVANSIVMLMPLGHYSITLTAFHHCNITTLQFHSVTMLKYYVETLKPYMVTVLKWVTVLQRYSVATLQRYSIAA